MIKTSICIFPDPKGKIDCSLNFVDEYCRICFGLLPQDRHRISVFCGQNDLLNQNVPINQLRTQTFAISKDEKIAGVLKSASSLISNQPNTFNVGRLIIICDQKSIKLRDPTNENFLSIAHNFLTQIDDSKLKFDRLYFDLIIFSESQEYSNIDVLSSNELIHVLVKHPNDAENYAQHSAFNHLKLSFFKMKKFQIFFLDIFEQNNVVVKNVKYQYPEDLVGPVEVSYPCVILNKDIPVMDELKNNVIIFQDEWLLSLHNGVCSLSKIGKFSENFENDVIKNFAFKADPKARLLIQDMPNKLIISPDGDNWKFTRTKASPAVNSLTRMSQLEDTKFVLFSPYFMRDKIRHKKAFSILGPILQAIAKSNPDNNDAELATKAINELFHELANTPQDTLNEIVLAENAQPDRLTYLKALEEKCACLIGEIKVILCWYKEASNVHKFIYQTFEDTEKRTGPIRFIPQ